MRSSYALKSTDLTYAEKTELKTYVGSMIDIVNNILITMPRVTPTQIKINKWPFLEEFFDQENNHNILYSLVRSTVDMLSIDTIDRCDNSQEISSMFIDTLISKITSLHQYFRDRLKTVPDVIFGSSCEEKKTKETINQLSPNEQKENILNFMGSLLPGCLLLAQFLKKEIDNNEMKGYMWDMIRCKVFTFYMIMEYLEKSFKTLSVANQRYTETIQRESERRARQERFIREREQIRAEYAKRHYESTFGHRSDDIYQRNQRIYLGMRKNDNFDDIPVTTHTIDRNGMYNMNLPD